MSNTYGACLILSLARMHTLLQLLLIPVTPQVTGGVDAVGAGAGNAAAAQEANKSTHWTRRAAAQQATTPTSVYVLSVIIVVVPLVALQVKQNTRKYHSEEGEERVEASWCVSRGSMVVPRCHSCHHPLCWQHMLSARI